MESVLAALVAAAERSVARTPSLLPILREAGVVDSGGQGLLRMFEGALLSVRGQAVQAVAGSGATPPHGDARPVVAPAFRRGLAALEEGAFGYETVFILNAALGETLDVRAIQDRLEALGNSVLVGGDARMVKVHVHNERPDEIIAYGLSLGSLTRITVENLDTMADDVREARVTEFVADDASPVRAELAAPVRAKVGAGAAGVGLAGRTVPPTDTKELPPPNVAAPGGSRARSAEAVQVDPDLGPAIVAVVAGDGLERVMLDSGAHHIVRGGQTANPSTGELLRIARLAKAREVIILPNNPNVRLAAEQAASICTDRRLVVVPTRNAAEGLAALLAYKPTLDAAANVGPMTAAAREITTVQVTEAVRDARIGGRKVRQGQTIVLDPDDGLVAVDKEADRAVMQAVETFPAGIGNVTIYYGVDASLMEAEALAGRIRARLPGLENVEVVPGGQPHYRYLISAE
jgi:DAK2 domain fusion protein YloV